MEFGNMNPPRASTVGSNLLLDINIIFQFQVTRLRVGSFALRPATSPVENLQPLITQTPLSCTTDRTGNSSVETSTRYMETVTAYGQILNLDQFKNRQPHAPASPNTPACAPSPRSAAPSARASSSVNPTRTKNSLLLSSSRQTEKSAFPRLASFCF